MEQIAPLDFAIPNEIIEIVMAYLSPEELFAMAAIGTDRIKKLTCSTLHKKLCGKYQFIQIWNPVQIFFAICNLNLTEVIFHFNFQSCQNCYAECHLKEILRKSNKYLNT